MTRLGVEPCTCARIVAGAARGARTGGGAASFSASVSWPRRPLHGGASSTAGDRRLRAADPAQMKLNVVLIGGWGGGGWLDARGWACKAGATARRTCPAAVAARSAAHAASSAAAGRRRVRVAVIAAGSRLFRRRARGASLPCAGSGCQPTALNQRAFPLSPSPPRGESHADRSCLSSILPHTTGLAPRLARAWPIVGPRLRLVGWAQPCDRPAMPPARNLAWAKVFTISLPEILHRRAALRLVPPPTAHACTGTLAAAQQSKHVFGQDTVFRTCRFCVVVAPQLEWSATREESLVEGDGERTVWRWHARARSEDDSGYETP